jgi:hypothetical protein
MPRHGPVRYWVWSKCGHGAGNGKGKGNADADAKSSLGIVQIRNVVSVKVYPKRLACFNMNNGNVTADESCSPKSRFLLV